MTEIFASEDFKLARWKLMKQPRWAGDASEGASRRVDKNGVVEQGTFGIP